MDNVRPKLCADRLDGVILTGISWTKTLEKEDVSRIVLDLRVFLNEFGEQEIGFKTKEILELVYSTVKK